MPRKNQSRIEISLSPQEKNTIIKNSQELGYSTISSYLLSCVHNQTPVSFDTSQYYEYARQIRAIGYNVNALIRDIRTNKFISDLDVAKIEGHLVEVEGLVKKEKQLMNQTMEKMEDKEFGQLLKHQNLEVPIQYIYDKILSDIKNSLMVFIGYVEQANFHQMWSNYIYKFMYEKLNIERFEYDQLVTFSNELFLFLQQLSTHLLNPQNQLSEDKFLQLKAIIDKYK